MNDLRYALAATFTAEQLGHLQDDTDVVRDSVTHWDTWCLLADLIMQARLLPQAPASGTESTLEPEQADTTPSDTPEPQEPTQAVEVIAGALWAWTIPGAPWTLAEPEDRNTCLEGAQIIANALAKANIINPTNNDAGVIGSPQRAGGLGLRPAQPNETPGAVEPDDARPQPQDLAARPEEAVEQAAIALREALNDPEHPFTATWDELRETQREFYLRMARAVVPAYVAQIVTLTAQAEADVTRFKTHLVTEQERLRGHLAAARADRDEARAEIRSFQLQVDRLHTIHHTETARLRDQIATLTSAQPTSLDYGVAPAALIAAWPDLLTTSLDYGAARAALIAAWPDLAGDPVYVEALVNVALMAATGGDR